MVEKERPEVWDVLEEVIKRAPRNAEPGADAAPAWAFRRSSPSLIEGQAPFNCIRLVCARHSTPISTATRWRFTFRLRLEAQMEARVLMMSTNNILSPANGKPDHCAQPRHRAWGCIMYLGGQRRRARRRQNLLRYGVRLKQALESGVGQPARQNQGAL